MALPSMKKKMLPGNEVRDSGALLVSRIACLTPEAYRTTSMAIRSSWKRFWEAREKGNLLYNYLGIVCVSPVLIFGNDKLVFLRVRQIILESYYKYSIFVETRPVEQLPNATASVYK